MLPAGSAEAPNQPPPVATPHAGDAMHGTHAVGTPAGMSAPAAAGERLVQLAGCVDLLWCQTAEQLGYATALHTCSE